MFIVIIELILIIASFAYGNYIGSDRIEARDEKAQLTAIAKQKAADETAYNELSNDQDGDIKYGIEQTNKYLAAQKMLDSAIKKHPIPVTCKPDSSIVQSINQLRTGK